MLPLLAMMIGSLLFVRTPHRHNKLDIADLVIVLLTLFFLAWYLFHLFGVKMP